MGGKSSQTNSTDQSMGIINAFVAQQQELDRQSRIKQGMNRIDGAFKGFDDDYFRNFATSTNEYQMPQEEKQYADAKKELTFRHARAGTLNSSMAANNTADLAKQNALNRATVLQQGDQAAANLRSRVASEKAGLISQLNSTSDPDLAATSALTASKGIGQDQPSLSPLGQMFNVGIVGAGNYMQGYNTGQAYKSAGFGSGGSLGGGASRNAGRMIGG
jgi:hypothetical protein